MIAVYILLILMIIGAWIAIEVKGLLSSVIAVGAVGLGLSLVCLILQAPDVAITQLVVEIIAVVLLIRATLKADLPHSPTGSRVVSGVTALAAVAVLLMIAWQCFKELPAFGEPLMRVSQRYIETSVADTGASNLVTAILLDFRAYDTLGEATVLFTAVIGVAAVVRRIGRKETEPTQEQKDA